MRGVTHFAFDDARTGRRLRRHVRRHQSRRRASAAPARHNQLRARHRLPPSEADPNHRPERTGRDALPFGDRHDLIRRHVTNRLGLARRPPHVDPLDAGRLTQPDVQRADRSAPDSSNPDFTSRTCVRPPAVTVTRAPSPSRLLRDPTTRIAIELRALPPLLRSTSGAPPLFVTTRSMSPSLSMSPR